MSRVLIVTVLLSLAAGAFAQEGEEKGWMGVRVRNLEEGEANELEFDREGGVMIQHVVPGSPAAKADLKEGDVLFVVRKLHLLDVASLMKALTGSKPGEKVGFAAWREGKVFDGRMVLAEMPGEFAGERARGELEGAFAEVRAALAQTREALKETNAAIEKVTAALMEAAELGEMEDVRKRVGAIRELSFQAAERHLRIRQIEQRLHEMELAAERGREAPHREREERGERSERNSAERDIEILRVAMKAFLEAERKDMAEMVEHAIHAIELRLKGRRDDEAMEIYRSAPKDGQMAELLGYAGKLYRDWKMPDRAEWCEKLSRTYIERHRAAQAREKEGAGEGEGRIRRLEGRLEELQRALEETRKELEAIRRDRR